jgi:hypothetical protein
MLRGRFQHKKWRQYRTIRQKIATKGLKFDFGLAKMLVLV